MSDNSNESDSLTESDGATSQDMATSRAGEDAGQAGSNQSERSSYSYS
jgi:hypothetical protein